MSTTLNRRIKVKASSVRSAAPKVVAKRSSLPKVKPRVEDEDYEDIVQDQEETLQENTPRVTTRSMKSAKDSSKSVSKSSKSTTLLDSCELSELVHNIAQVVPKLKVSQVKLINKNLEDLQKYNPDVMKYVSLVSDVFDTVVNEMTGDRSLFVLHPHVLEFINNIDLGSYYEKLSTGRGRTCQYEERGSFSDVLQCMETGVANNAIMSKIMKLYIQLNHDECIVETDTESKAPKPVRANEEMLKYLGDIAEQLRQADEDTNAKSLARSQEKGTKYVEKKVFDVNLIPRMSVTRLLTAVKGENDELDLTDKDVEQRARDDLKYLEDTIDYYAKQKNSK